MLLLWLWDRLKVIGRRQVVVFTARRYASAVYAVVMRLFNVQKAYQMQMLQFIVKLFQCIYDTLLSQ